VLPCDIISPSLAGPLVIEQMNRSACRAVSPYGLARLFIAPQDSSRPTVHDVAGYLPRPRRRASRHPGSALSRGVAMYLS